jgi:hypothetical protein
MGVKVPRAVREKLINHLATTWTGLCVLSTDGNTDAESMLCDIASNWLEKTGY